MIKTETDWLDDPCNCDSCGEESTFSYLVPTPDGDNICKVCDQALYEEPNPRTTK